ncbi:single-strand selective monofunctional uracil DNA glycosylase-like isoform X2 [Plodia interpunctella]|uniref:single-strand selective monofunctional uracil DNA glycosylase-like isoform X2 n=1 Tax=Plodia interpunctella TaxID=58824 RepID=UPI0023675855|nr:single-strand selective monofunctional uracil DNA glycosylase-like isoform X2 [Plodia interpunctella]
METAPEVISSFFVSENNVSKAKDIADEFLELLDQLNSSLNQLELPRKVECVYNPTVYARHTFEMYVRKFCNTKKTVMYFGMNPGPWGMSQTGVPFGEISSVKDWLGIEGPVGKPAVEIANRRVLGFACNRTEVSGLRFWGLTKRICTTSDDFFKTSFVYNYLPQQWMNSKGTNITPGDFSLAQLRPLFDICDPIFCKVLQLYEVKIIIAIGKFCEKRAEKALKTYLPNNSVQAGLNISVQ